jgi:hypothetical protein
MSALTDVLLWAQRVVARQGASAHQILEIPAGSPPAVAQEAFHKIARMAHPDLHRRTLSPDELELVTTAYARAAAAYQELRGVRQTTSRIRTTRDPETKLPGSGEIPIPPGVSKAEALAAEATAGPAMTPKAVLYYRKAELALNRGDLRGAVLQLKMAIASDPQSQFLRSALAEVEREAAKKS